MTSPKVPRRSVAENLSDILASPEVSRLIDQLQATRWTGRPGYPLGAMVGMALAKSLYTVPTWTRTGALVREHPTLAAVIAPDAKYRPCMRATALRASSATMPTSCKAASLAS